MLASCDVMRGGMPASCDVMRGGIHALAAGHLSVCGWVSYFITHYNVIPLLDESL